MGFGVDSLRFLLSAQKLGFDGKTICTLGRQATYISRRNYRSLLKEYGKEGPSYPEKAMCFSEDYLTPLGFQIEAMDASNYEGADLIHDLNQPIPNDLRCRYDLLWDGGTLEHIFNFPLAIQNVMQMTKVGGHILLETPANNQCGHGFYQFSPELFFRLFTPANGFELLRIYITCEGKSYHVVDPASVHGRVELRNGQGAILRVHARKIADKPLSSIQQSDYLDNWQAAEHVDRKDGRVKGYLRRVLSPDAIRVTSRLLNRARTRRNIWRWKLNSRLSNKRFYRPVTDWNEPGSHLAGPKNIT